MAANTHWYVLTSCCLLAGESPIVGTARRPRSKQPGCLELESDATRPDHTSRRCVGWGEAKVALPELA
jgi:hypothetical protein